MTNEFEVHAATGDIVCDPWFTRKMEKMMPSNRIIQVSEDDDDGYYIWRVKGDHWYMSEYMFERIIDGQIDELAIFI